MHKIADFNDAITLVLELKEKFGRKFEFIGMSNGHIAMTPNFDDLLDDYVTIAQEASAYCGHDIYVHCGYFHITVNQSTTLAAVKAEIRRNKEHLAA